MLTGKSAIVTGSTSGIGLAIATAFAAHGADVMLDDFGRQFRHIADPARPDRSP
jgi:NAD(P)-dependent dehydrogenase (short-subunit alcohol dehydrogenase family)